MKLVTRIAKLLFIISIFGMLLVVVYSGVILEIRNNSKITIKEVSINYGRGTYFLPELKSGETVRNRVGKIGEWANFEIVWKYGENNAGGVTYNVYFTDILSPTRISITFPDEKSALLEYRGKVYKPHVKSGT